MPVTSLRTPKGNVVLMTIPDRNYIFIELYAADENFNPYGEPERSIEHTKTDEQIHREVREGAGAKGFYVKEHSTNPEYDIPIEKPKNNEQS